MKRVRTTSAAVYRDLQPSLQRREQIVLDALTAWQGPRPTSYELTRWLQADHLAFDVNSCRPRISALVDKGLLEPGPKRSCRVTGKTAFTWIVVAPRPEPYREPEPQRLEF